ncbi:MAG: phage tail protein [Nannocystaceae bacterium]
MTTTAPYPAFHFEVELGGGSGAFAEVHGLAGARTIHTYRNGDEAVVRTLIELDRPSPVSLRRGIMGSLDLHQWYRAPRPREVVVSLLDADQQPVQRWRLRGCVPTALVGPRLGALRNEVAIEELVLQPAAIAVE